VEVTHIGDSANAVRLLKAIIKEMKGFSEQLHFLK